MSRVASPDGKRGVFATSVVAFALSLLFAQCGRSPTGPTNPLNPSPNVPGPSVPNPTVPTPGPEVAVAVGDIAICGPDGRQDVTSRLLDTLGGPVLALGDMAYPNGSRENFMNCYDKSWGRHAGRTRPSPGNHDYTTTGAAPYFDYFGINAGIPGLGYYSFDLGAWHVISLNSNAEFMGVGAASPQGQWLQNDLAGNRAKCTVAYWHHPLFSSGQNGDNVFMRPIFNMLYEANADLVLNGHDHLYERFAPQAADGRNDPARGIREFIVGTGGVPLYPFTSVKPNSEARINDTFGVLKLALLADSYQWEFHGPGGIRDSGTASCH
jgi:hypothetical protein